MLTVSSLHEMLFYPCLSALLTEGPFSHRVGTVDEDEESDTGREFVRPKDILNIKTTIDVRMFILHFLSLSLGR